MMHKTQELLMGKEFLHCNFHKEHHTCYQYQSWMKWGVFPQEREIKLQLHLSTAEGYNLHEKTVAPIGETMSVSQGWEPVERERSWKCEAAEVQRNAPI